MTAITGSLEGTRLFRLSACRESLFGRPWSRLPRREVKELNTHAGIKGQDARSPAAGNPVAVIPVILGAATLRQHAAGSVGARGLPAVQWHHAVMVVISVPSLWV